jgi:hypothetical protein
MSDAQNTLIDKAEAAINLDPYAPLAEHVEALIAALRAAQARVAVIESAARVDIDAANAECAARDCKAWISRGVPCDQCPCSTVSVIAGCLNFELCSDQSIEGFKANREQI